MLVIWTGIYKNLVKIPYRANREDPENMKCLREAFIIRINDFNCV